MAQQINLIDASLLPARRRLGPVSLLATVGTAIALVLAHLGWEQVALARALAQATADAPAATEDGSVAEPDAATADRLARREALRDLLRRQLSVADGSALLLGEIIHALPDSLWLTELELGAQRALRISGGAADTEGFAQFATRLRLIPALQGLPISTVRLEPRPEDSAVASPGTTPLPASQLFVLASAPGASATPTPATP